MGTVTDGANDVCPSRGSTLVRARLVTYAQARGTSAERTAPSVQARCPVTPPLRSHNTESDPKQTSSLALPLPLFPLYFNLFLSQSHPLLLSASVSPCYYSLPCVVHPSSAFFP